jgi:ATP-dependent DNA ligase
MYNPSLCVEFKISEIDKLKNHIFQNKEDGMRVLAEIKDTVTLYNRHNEVIHFPLIQEALKEFPNCVLDGELISDDFSKLVSIAHSNNKDESSLKFIVFDILEIEGKYIGNRPYTTRRLNLSLLPFNDKIQLIQDYTDYKHIWETSKEGIIAKRRNSIYQHKRTTDWIKIKHFKEKILKFDKYELHSNEAGITLDNGKDRVSVGSQEISNQIIEYLKGHTFISVEVQYLEDNEHLRFPSFKRIVGGE